MDITVKEAAEKFGFEILAGEAGTGGKITGVYIGDLLSWVMARAPESGAWITIQGHVNTVAVALLTGASCIIIAEGAEADADTLKKADTEGIPVLSSKLNSFEIAREFVLSELK